MTTHRPTIFVSIASYRDSQCQYTLHSLFTQATYPERVVAGVCHQVAPEDKECFLLDLDRWAPQIRTYFIRHDEAKGPCFARALIQQELLKDEDYYLQLDSHFRLVDGWDELLLAELAACPSARPVLTTLAAAYELPRGHRPGGPDDAMLNRRECMAVLCADKFGDQCPGQDDAFLRIKSRVCRTSFGGMPPPALFWTARFHFSSAQVVRECPYDPFLDYVFFGEEISMAARLFTSGWDLFNPTRTVGYHLQSRSHRPFYTEVQTSELSIRRHRYAKGRLYRLLGDNRNAIAVEAGLGGSAVAPSAPYGLGVQRTMAMYEAFCGVTFLDHIITDHGRRGGVAKELLAPTWAEEARSELQSARCLVSPEDWAGRGNAEALHRQFPEATSVERGGGGGGGPSAEVMQALNAVRLREAELRAATTGGMSLEQVLEYGRLCVRLGELSSQAGDAHAATEAFAEALSAAARGAAEEEALAASAQDQARRRLSLILLQGGALAGLQHFPQAKAVVEEALVVAGELVLVLDDDVSEVLALEVLALLHRVYEQTDDRVGVEGLLPGLRVLLTNVAMHAERLQGRSPTPPSPPSAPDLQEPPTEGPETVTARLLDALLLLALATGTDAGDTLGRRVFTDCPVELRGSARLRRQLGMLQAGGLFLDLVV